MYVDSHCHLNFPELQGRLPEIQREMAAAGVDRALSICTTLEEFTVGVHPDNEGVREPTAEVLLDLARRPRVVGLGETGLDYYRLNGRSVADMAWQRDRFRVHIRAAQQTALPLVVHTRSASADTLDVLRDEGQGRVCGVFHCFTETREVARAALDLGFMISFSGILTFRNADELRDVARMVPLDRCLVETDAPYLAPMPHRGKTNTPAWVPHVGAKLAEVKGLSVEAVAEQTSLNFDRLFARARAGAAVA
jgi:TatD DNase family protein